MAEDMKIIFAERGYKFFIDSPTNQQFIVLSDEKIDELNKKVGFEIWERYDDSHQVVRFATSFATTKADVEYLKEIL